MDFLMDLQVPPVISWVLSTAIMILTMLATKDLHEQIKADFSEVHAAPPSVKLLLLLNIMIVFAIIMLWVRLTFSMFL